MSIPIINGKRVEIADMNAAHMHDILMGNVCYACGQYKRPRNSHCYGCYNLLPRHMKRALHQRFGQGYEDAYKTSLEWLARHKVSKDDLVFGPIVTQKV